MQNTSSIALEEAGEGHRERGNNRQLSSVQQAEYWLSSTQLQKPRYEGLHKKALRFLPGWV